MAVTITPADDGRLEVYLDGQTIFDRKAEGGDYPSLTNVRAWKKIIRDKIAVAV